MGGTIYWVWFCEFWIGCYSCHYDDISYISATYHVNVVIDTYFMVSFEALLLVNAMKQFFSFAISYGIIPWITLSGFQGAFGTMVGIQCGLLLLGVPLWYWGKEIRHKSASWKVVMY